MKRTAIAVAVLTGIAMFSVPAACTDTDYHGTVSDSNAPAVTTVATHSANAVPVTVSGTGEAVKTVELEAGGYTVSYQASSNCLIVQPVQADGSDGIAVVNQCASGDGPVSGTTTFHAHGRTTIHVSNTDGSWTLTFNPLT